MSTSLASLADNLSEINNKDCKKCIERNKIKSECQYIKHKDNRLIYKCKKCDDISNKSADALKEKFPNTYQLCNEDLNKFILLLRKGVYPYEYMDSWERFNETTLPDKEYFYSELHLEDITDEDYVHAQNVWNVFKIKNLGEYHDLYVQSDTLLLSEIFDKFRDTCIKIYELDPAQFLSTPGLACQACLKKTGVELELLTDYDMFLMIESGIRGGICQSVHRYARVNNEHMKSYDKNKLSSYLMYLDANSLCGWAMCKKLPIGNFRWATNLSKYTESFIKKYDENSDTGCFLEVDIEYPRTLWGHHKDLPFLPEKKKLKNVEKLVTSIEDKEKYVIHISTLKQALDHGLKLKKVNRVIEFNQEA